MWEQIKMHPKLRRDKRIELHEKTDIRNFHMDEKPDIVLIDVSFISLRDILPYIHEQFVGRKNSNRRNGKTTFWGRQRSDPRVLSKTIRYAVRFYVILRLVA